MSRSESSKLLKSRWLGRKEVRDKVKEEERFVKSMDSLVELARHSITSNLNGSKNFEEYVETQIKKEWNTTNFDKIKNMWGSEKLGVRISLFVDNEFRGSFGSIKSIENVYDDVISHSIKACIEDDRFPPVTWKEFKKLLIEVTLVDDDEIPIEYKDPLELCMILERDREKGVLIRHPKGTFAYHLPDTWDLIPDPAMFLTTLCSNAKLPPSAWRGESRLWPQKVTERKRNLYTGEVIEPEEYTGISIYHLNVRSTVGDGKS